jgi:hypothetical protein
MFIAQIVVPGTWVAHPDRDGQFELGVQLTQLENHFFEANAALHYFEEARRTRPAPQIGNWDADMQRRRQIHEHLVQELDRPLTIADARDIDFRSEVLFKQEEWAQGRLPSQFQMEPQFAFARAFIFAVDAFERLLAKLCQPQFPATLPTLHAEISASFPDLRMVRNSAHHVEDRIRGLASENKPLDRKPIAAGGINAPGGGIVVIGSLCDSRYGATMANGEFGEVDVSKISMLYLQRIFQGVLNSFDWIGPPQHLPRR